MKKKEFDIDNNNNVNNNNPKSSKEDNLGIDMALSESSVVSRDANAGLYLERGELVEGIDYIARDVGRIGSNVLMVSSKMTRMMDKVDNIEGLVRSGTRCLDSLAARIRINYF